MTTLALFVFHVNALEVIGLALLCVWFVAFILWILLWSAYEKLRARWRRWRGR